MVANDMHVIRRCVVLCCVVLCYDGVVTDPPFHLSFSHEREREKEFIVLKDQSSLTSYSLRRRFFFLT